MTSIVAIEFPALWVILASKDAEFRRYIGWAGNGILCLNRCTRRHGIGPRRRSKNRSAHLVATLRQRACLRDWRSYRPRCANIFRYALLEKPAPSRSDALRGRWVDRKHIDVG